MVYYTPQREWIEKGGIKLWLAFFFIELGAGMFFIGSLRLHDIRHSHATILFKQGVHPKIVQERLGHATISTTLDIYSHVVPGLQAAAAAGFDSILLPKENKLEIELKELIQK
jgi:integrase